MACCFLCRRRRLVQFLRLLMLASQSASIALLLSFNTILFIKFFFPEIGSENGEMVQNSSIFDCDKEELVYGWRIEDTETGKVHVGRGKKFDCRLINYLHKFKLSDHSYVPKNLRAKAPAELNGAIFVIAGNVRFYHSVRAVIATIKRTFGIYQKIILYDLGGIARNRVMMSELGRVCNLEIRQFDFKQLPRNVRGLKTFSWKILILAEMYSEFDTFIYCDTSVHFLNGNFDTHFEWINRGKVSPFLFMMGTYHGIKHATLPETFDFLPLYMSNQFDIEMQEANFLIVHKSEFTRKILKWSVLCALTLGCIEPRKVVWRCPEIIFHTNRNYGLCHRMDQSAMSILAHNAEAEIVGSGNTQLIRHFDYNHPSHRMINHILVRTQGTLDDIDRLYTC